MSEERAIERMDTSEDPHQTTLKAQTSFKVLEVKVDWRLEVGCLQDQAKPVYELGRINEKISNFAKADHVCLKTYVDSGNVMLKVMEIPEKKNNFTFIRGKFTGNFMVSNRAFNYTLHLPSGSDGGIDHEQGLTFNPLLRKADLNACITGMDSYAQGLHITGVLTIEGNVSVVDQALKRPWNQLEPEFVVPVHGGVANQTERPEGAKKMKISASAELGGVKITASAVEE